MLETTNIPPSTTFLDMEQSFNGVWLTGLSYKLKELPALLYYLFNIVKSKLAIRKFQVKFRDYISNLRLAQTGVLHESALGPLLYSYFLLIYQKMTLCSDQQMIPLNLQMIWPFYYNEGPGCGLKQTVA